MLKSNKIIIISGASGSGKTTLVDYLLSFQNLNLKFSVSACSRNRRSYEIEGRHYIFLSLEKFHQKINSNDFLEWEEVYKNNFYGTLKSNTIDMLNSRKNILFDVDVKGAESIKNYFKEQALGIFIKAPSKTIARERLINRNTDSLSAINVRIKKIENEIKIGSNMDCQLINDNLEISKKQIYNLVKRFLES